MTRDNYITIRVQKSTKQAIINATLPHETLSDTIERVCNHYINYRKLIESDWKQQIEVEIANLKKVLQLTEDTCKDVSKSFKTFPTYGQLTSYDTQGFTMMIHIPPDVGLFGQEKKYINTSAMDKEIRVYYPEGCFDKYFMHAIRDKRLYVFLRDEGYDSVFDLDHIIEFPILTDGEEDIVQSSIWHDIIPEPREGYISNTGYFRGFLPNSYDFEFEMVDYEGDGDNYFSGKLVSDGDDRILTKFISNIEVGRLCKICIQYVGNGEFCAKNIILSQPAFY
jgi:hypothetical protein